MPPASGIGATGPDQIESCATRALAASLASSIVKRPISEPMACRHVSRRQVILMGAAGSM
jgi:hypothetical protein